MLAAQSLAAVVFFVTFFSTPSSAQAANVTLSKSTTRTTVSCQTIMAATQPLGNISTVTNTISSNATFNLRHTSTPSIISIPATVTSTNVKTAHTVTTLTQGNNSFSTTTKTAVRTYYNYVPGVTNYTTVTATQTTTLTTLTSTLRTSSGFRDIKASKQTCNPVVPASPPMMRRDDGAQTDDGEDDTESLISPSSVPTAGLIRINAAMFPAAVTCVATVVTSTGYTTVVPANVTTTKLGRTPTTFVDTTTTLTNTHYSVLRNVTRVFTQTSTSTYMLTQTIRPITSTAYTTSTLTLSTATSTFIGACKTQRLLGPTIAANASYPRAERGLTVDDIYYNQNTLQLWTSFKKTSYDCCASCHDTDDCAFGGWDSITEICYLQRHISEQCPSQNLTQGVYVMANRTTTHVPFAFEAFNGACGYLSDGGVGV